MSIFRNRSTQRSQRFYEQDRDDGPPEPRLFTARQPANNWPKEEESPSMYEEAADPYSSQRAPQWQEPHRNRVEDLHPRELSFWREERLYEDYNQGIRQSSPFRFILVTASILIIATFSWLAFRWVSTPHSEAPPLIYADPTPYKGRPDHPGGLQVPYQDRLVYSRLSPESQQPVERLLPQPEQPIAVPPPQQQYAYGPQPTDSQQQPAYGYEQQAPYPPQQMAPGYGQPQPMAPGYGPPPQQAPYPQQQQMGPAPQQQQMPSHQQPTSGYAPQQYAYPPQPPIHQQQMANGHMGPQGMATNPAPQQQPISQQKPTAAAIDEIIDGELTPNPKVKPSQKPKATVLPTNAYRIQIATLATEDAAKKELERIRRAHPDLVSKLTSAIQRVEGEAGVCRILFGPFANREAAIKQCTKCRTRGFSCIVLNPS